MHSNHLSHETSPYLLQHADNPVMWYPWGPEALEKARADDKPILLSIGYSACHWCHVMAHESFEDNDTAALMNRLFINIKVDREERPDLDKIYQMAHQMITRRGGGWPLTLILTPEDQVPFYGGTYFPSEPRFGLPAFKELLQQIETFYRQNRGEIRDQNQKLVDAFNQMEPSPNRDDVKFATKPLDVARHQLEHSFDPQFGGFSNAPKFPHPTHLHRLLQHWATSKHAKQEDAKALQMLEKTLDNMALGGLNDQIGGGFCRYSVDAKWMIPHFEKMLYDNAQLLPIYAQASVARDNAHYKRIAHETANWTTREMQAPEGGYYSSIDADSEGQEGKFYIWNPDQVKALLSTHEYRVIEQYFGLNQAANFEGDWHLHITTQMATIAADCQQSKSQIQSLLDSARSKLFTARKQRIHPGRDEKILTSWNALMIKGMSIAGRTLDRQDFIESAGRSLEFIHKTLWKDGRLLATYKDGRAHLPAYLDDYVYLIEAILEYLQAKWDKQAFDFMIDLAEATLTHFEDIHKDGKGGFFFTANDHEDLMHRPKPLGDDATPSGNGVAALAFARLGYMLAEPRYIDASIRTLKAAWSSILELPYGHSSLLNALEEIMTPPQIVIIRGAETKLLNAWHKRCTTHFAPHRLVFVIPNDADGLPDIIRKYSSDQDIIAYICEGTSCSAPITDFAELDKQLINSEINP